MLSARQFLEETFDKIEDDNKRNRFYLNVLTFGIDKQFIIDLNKVIVKLLPADKVLNDILDFITFTTNKPENDDLNSAFTNYLVT